MRSLVVAGWRVPPWHAHVLGTGDATLGCFCGTEGRFCGILEEKTAWGESPSRLGVRSLPLDLQRLHPSRLICSHRRRGYVTAWRGTARRYDTAWAQSSLWHTRNNLMRLGRETPEAGLEPATRRLTAGCSTS